MLSDATLVSGFGINTAKRFMDPQHQDSAHYILSIGWERQNLQKQVTCINLKIFGICGSKEWILQKILGQILDHVKKLVLT